MNDRINLRLIPAHCKEGREVQFVLCVSAATRLASTSGAEAKASKRSDNLAALERFREIAVDWFRDSTRRCGSDEWPSCVMRTTARKETGIWVAIRHYSMGNAEV